MLRRDLFFFRIFCIIFWVMGTSSFIFEEFIPPLEILKAPILLVADISMVVLCIKLIRDRRDILLISLFVIVGAIVSFMNSVPTLLWVNGIRDYIGMLTALPILRYFFNSNDAAYFKKSFDKQLKIYFFLQAFCVTEQFIRYGANDHGGGAMGNWSSGSISMIIIMLSFYFVLRDWDPDDYLKSLWRNRWYIFFVFPVFLNETKVSFVILAVYFVLLFPLTKKSFVKLLIAIPVMIISFIMLVSLYLWATGDENDVASVDYIANYLTGGDDAEELIDLADYAVEFVELSVEEWNYADLPRFIKFGILPDALNDSEGGILLGAGFGHLKGGTTLEQTKFHDEHLPLLYGTNPMLNMIAVPLGLVGLVWAFFWFKYALAFSKRAGWQPLRLKLMLLFITLLSFLYISYFRYIVPCIVFYYLCVASTYKVSEDDEESDKAKEDIVGQLPA